MGLEEDIKTLKDRLDKIESERERKVESFKLDERVYIDDIISRSYRFHKTAIDSFNEVIQKDKLKIYNVQDLISQALWEFSEKYKNLNS